MHNGDEVSALMKKIPSLQSIVKGLEPLCITYKVSVNFWSINNNNLPSIMTASWNSYLLGHPEINNISRIYLLLNHETAIGP